MEITKSFIFIYAIFTILISITGLSNISFEYQETQIPDNVFNVFDIGNFVWGVISFIFQLLTYSTPYAILNILLWGFRIVSIIELVKYGKELIPVAG